MRFYERSAGAVVYIVERGDVFYLLLHGRFGWDFPHGLVHLYETDEAAAIREILEETGLKVELIPSFKEEIRYKYSKKGRTVYREVVYFLARSREKEVKLSKEHDSYIWAAREEVLRLVSRDEIRAVLLKAWKKILETEKLVEKIS
ncbi:MULTISPECIES: bis(5'-nucleosyl)-tetraphosphatase [Pyrobaculum]|uniref:Bis(5'-nucleosyl)-tetraphosphatase [asymmetrical] n=1 Tax=Pyrobaculum arsenaticum TaxID=121277 RepID=A0A7L4P9G8_9CREN|nr:NUDIX domain-containing protein [Pyrobaculum arsenaticum]MCY0889373.1 NUDIX domain-containing protein [Pyrobaculum arsenaticum]NYR15589.1 NUDIX domain-containing protein [Pyrobaculum arsenaticum]